MADASKLTDQELIDEMLKRFIVPQFYTRENAEERWNIETDDDFGIIQDELRNMYIEVDEIVDEAVAIIKEGWEWFKNDDEGYPELFDNNDEMNELDNENKKLKNILHKALELDDTIGLGKFEEEDVRTIDSFKSLNQKLRGLIHETFKAKSLASLTAN